MRVALVSPYALDQPGGLQQQCVQLMDRLNRRGHEAWLVGPGRSGPPGSRLVAAPVAVPANGSVAQVGLDPRLGARLRAEVASADVVHVHEPLTPLVSWAALRVSLPLVGTFHADPPRWVRRLYRAGAPPLRRLLARLRAATAVSDVAAEAVDRLIDAVEVIPAGVSVDDFVPADRAGLRVAFLGRDERRKGLDVLLAAWPSVAKAVPGAELVVMGASRDASLARATFLGKVSYGAKVAELAKADVLCAPNLGAESLGIVLVEGMAAGCAVVASDLPAFASTLGEAGFLVPPGDAAALADALVTVLRDPALRARLGERGRQRARFFDWSEVLPRYEEAYERALRR